MKALVLSAGYGERLRPLTYTTPKPLLEVAGRPLIHYALLTLKAAGITQVAVNVHHLARQIEKAVGDGQTLGLAITYSYETVPMGTGGPLLALRDYFAQDSFVILNSDTIMDLDLADVIACHRANGGVATLVLRADKSNFYSRIEIDATTCIRRMRLRTGHSFGAFNDYPAELEPAIAATLQSYMYCGVMIGEPSLLMAIPPTPPFGLVGDLLAPCLSKGAHLFGYVHDRFFRTVDDLVSYEALRTEFTTRELPLACLGIACSAIGQD